MASNAGWQTSASGRRPDNTTDEQCSERRFETPDRPATHASIDALLKEPMDQHTVASLLRRLLDRIEETERRYGRALDALHARLDQLSQTTNTARSTSAPENADTFDRLHEQVSSLARRLEGEPNTHLDDFERLGRVLADSRQSQLHPGSMASPREEPAPSQFAQSLRDFHRPNHLAPEVTPRFDWRSDTKPETATPDCGDRLTEMANRLEQSIGAAMPSSTIEALNTRLEEIGRQIAESLKAAPSGTALQYVERQIADMGRQINRAEDELSRLGGVEERLVQILARLEDKDAAPKAPDTDAAQLQEVAAKAAVEAARLVADDSRKTTDRIEAMQRELNAVSQNSRQANEKLNSSLQSVHASLRQLVQQFERPIAQSAKKNPFVAEAERKRTASAKPAPAQPVRAAPKQPAPSKEAVSETPKPAAKADPVREQQAGKRQQDQQRPKDRRQPAPSRPERPVDDAELRVKETLRSRLDTKDKSRKSRNLLAAFERARAPHVETAAQDLGGDMGSDADTPREKTASEEMVAAARRAAQAAAAQAAALAESRDQKPEKKVPRLHVASEDHNRDRRRPYLILAAAILLAISALLLFGRLGSNATDEVETIAPTDEATAPIDANPTAPTAPAVSPAKPQSGSSGLLPRRDVAPPPGMVPLHNRVGEAKSGVTNFPKSLGQATPPKVITPIPQLASLNPNEMTSIADDVVFSIEEPSPAKELALAEELTASSAKGPPPPESVGSEALREAASRGNPVAQYAVATRYIDGRHVMADPKTGSEWMERAARSGLAPAQYRLGTMYERGIGVDADVQKARGWYLAAAERGNVKAMHNLAVSVSSGSKPNYPLAAKWYGEAAKRNLKDSQFNLGILAEHGLGRTKDLAEAYRWYALAASQGDEEAHKRLDVISAQLSSKKIVELDAKLVTWKPKALSREANTITEPAGWGGQATSRESDLVSRAQTLLNKLGYDVGSPDGLTGDETKAGVKRFQEQNGLTQTGEVTTELVAKLEALAN